MPETKPERNDRYFESSSVLLVAMSNPMRLRILTIISLSEVSVGPLSDMVGLSQSATSQHLAKLRHAGIVSTRQDGHNVYYSCRSKSAKRVLAMLNELFPADYIPEKAA